MGFYFTTSLDLGKYTIRAYADGYKDEPEQEFDFIEKGKKYLIYIWIP